MKSTETLEKSQYISWLIRFLKIYESVNRKYVKEIHWVSTVPFGIPSYNTLENRLMIFEVIGLLSSFAIYLHTLSYATVE
jgi:hypothetical protein